jgi:hypothetical protein
MVMSELEEYVLNEQVRKIADHMDFGVISMLLIDSCGWTRVELEALFPAPKVEILEWTNANCVGRFMNSGKEFIFEDKHDALMFKLKWS